MYLYHITKNTLIKSIFRDKKLRGFNWSDAHKNSETLYGHALLSKKYNELFQESNSASKNIYRICAWAYEDIATELCNKLNSAYQNHPQSSIIRFNNQDMLDTGFNQSVDDMSKYGSYVDSTYQYWSVEINSNKLSDNGLHTDNIEIYDNGNWFPITQLIVNGLP